MAAVLQETRAQSRSHTVRLPGGYELEFDCSSNSYTTDRLCLTAALLRPRRSSNTGYDYGKRRLAFAIFHQPNTDFASLYFCNNAIWLGSTNFDLPPNAIAPLRAWLQECGLTIVAEEDQ